MNSIIIKKNKIIKFIEDSIVIHYTKSSSEFEISLLEIDVLSDTSLKLDYIDNEKIDVRINLNDNTKLELYETRKSSWPLVVLQTIASCLGISIGFMKTTISVTIATILFLIFNSSALPLLQGILISGIDKNLRVTGFGIVNILTQLLTSGTTPLLYGIINDRYKDRYPWLAMVCIMSMEFIAVPLLILLAILRNRKFDKEEELKNKEQGTELIEK